MLRSALDIPSPFFDLLKRSVVDKDCCDHPVVDNEVFMVTGSANPTDLNVIQKKGWRLAVHGKI